VRSNCYVCHSGNERKEGERGKGRSASVEHRGKLRQGEKAVSSLIGEGADEGERKKIRW